MSRSPVTVVVAPASIVDLAAGWAKAGLVGRSLWIIDDDVRGREHWDEAARSPARVLADGADPTPMRLSEALDEYDEIDQLRVLWVRYADAADGDASTMSLLRDAVLKAMPQVLDDRWFADLVVPRDVRDLHVPPVVQEWQQFVLSPEDRAAPDAADTIYDPDSADGQALHGALVLGGILGGVAGDQRRLASGRLSEPTMIHPFSRVVVGGDRATEAVHRFLRDEVPHLTAARVRPRSFVEPDEDDAEHLIDGAVEWVRGLDDGALRFDPPRVPQQTPEWWRRFAQFFATLGRFILWALRAMYGLRAILHWLRTAWARLQKRFESDDMGALMGDEPDPYDFGLVDWKSREGEANGRVERELRAERAADGATPGPYVWEALAALVVSLVDGSTPPTGWEMPGRHGRRFAIAPDAVFRAETEVGGADGFVEVSRRAELGRALARIRRIGRGEFAAALEFGTERLGSAGVEFDRVERRPGSKTARAIAAAAAEADAARRQDDSGTLASLREDVGAAESRAVLPRLRSRVVGDYLGATLTAARLARRVAFPEGAEVPDIEPIIRRAARELALLALGVVAGVVLIVAFRDDLDLILEEFVPFIGDSGRLLWILGVAAAVSVAGRFLELFRHYRAYNEIGGRRVEHIERRGEAAVAATAAANRLRNGDRILSHWEDVLSALLRPDIEVAPVEGDPIAGLPDSIRVAAPTITDEELRDLIATKGVEPGWCAATLRRLEDEHAGGGRAQLHADDGMRGSLLDQLSRAVTAGGPVESIWEAWAESRIGRVMAELGAGTTQVAYRRGSALRRLELREFVEEIADLDVYEAGREYEPSLEGAAQSTAHAASGGSARADIEVTRLLAQVATAVSLRRFERGGRGSGRPAVKPDADGWGR